MEKVTENYAIYEGDCIEKMQQMPNESIDMCVYSPPFSNMYTYSSDDRDLSNSNNYDEFLTHYKFVVQETARLLKSGRTVAIHCMDIPLNGDNGMIDFPADIIRIHKECGFVYWDRKTIWKDPLLQALRTRQRQLVHAQLVKDSTRCRGVLPDYILVFKKKGENKEPVTHQFGLTRYAGDLELMNVEDKKNYKFLLNEYINHEDDKTNRLSHFIWKRYADCMWEDIRPTAYLEYKKARDKDDERHLTPTSLDAIDRLITMYTNPKDVILTPFMGCGTEVYCAVSLGRFGVGIELKDTYFSQSAKNLENVKDRFAMDNQVKLSL